MKDQITLKINSNNGIVREYAAINKCPKCGKKLYRQTTFNCSVLGKGWQSVDKLYCMNGCKIDMDNLIIEPIK